MTAATYMTVAEDLEPAFERGGHQEVVRTIADIVASRPK